MSGHTGPGAPCYTVQHIWWKNPPTAQNECCSWYTRACVYIEYVYIHMIFFLLSQNSSAAIPALLQHTPRYAAPLPTTAHPALLEAGMQKQAMSSGQADSKKRVNFCRSEFGCSKQKQQLLQHNLEVNP